MIPEITTTTPRTIPLVEITLTETAFASAHDQGITHIAPDLVAMQHIANEIGLGLDGLEYDAEPLMLVLREAGRLTKGNRQWDTRLPTHSTALREGRYLSANSLNNAESPASYEHAVLVERAQHIGATALTELTVWGWRETDRRSHAASFAAGLLLGQRPLLLPPLARIGARVLGATPQSRAEELRRIELLEHAVRQRDSLPEPFIITRA